MAEHTCNCYKGYLYCILNFDYFLSTILVCGFVPLSFCNNVFVIIINKNICVLKKI
jgi:hypothetical protein